MEREPSTIQPDRPAQRPEGERRADGGRPSGRPGGRPPQPSGRRDSGRPEEQGRRRKGGQRQAGWGDGIDRGWCARRIHEPAETFPVTPRNAATRVVVPVARRPGAMLLCDGAHWGDHLWPDFSEATEAEMEAARAGVDPAPPAVAMVFGGESAPGLPAPVEIPEAEFTEVGTARAD